MKAVFQDYLTLAADYAPDRCPSRADKQARHARMRQWRQQAHEAPNVAEIAAFLHELHRRKLPVLTPFWLKFLPVLRQDIDEGGTAALKLLVGNGGEDDEMRCHSLLADETWQNINPCALLLEREPDYLPALNLRHSQMRCYIAYSIHEVPWGVLSDQNGATQTDIAEMLVFLDDFAEIARRSGCGSEADRHLVGRARIYYRAWADYLAHPSAYASYRDYLEQHEIAF